VIHCVTEEENSAPLLPHFFSKARAGANVFWRSAYVFVNRITYQGALFVKKQGIRASRRKKKSLTGRVTEKSVFVFVDKINTEEEKC
jgi:hypothetical protein